MNYKSPLELESFVRIPKEKIAVHAYSYSISRSRILRQAVLRPRAVVLRRFAQRFSCIFAPNAFPFFLDDRRFMHRLGAKATDETPSYTASVIFFHFNQSNSSLRNADNEREAVCRVESRYSLRSTSRRSTRISLEADCNAPASW